MACDSVSTAISRAGSTGHCNFSVVKVEQRKASDEFAVPLCRIHHRLVHRVGNEAAWWKDAGIDPAKAARKLWNDGRTVQGRIAPGPRRNLPRRIEQLTLKVRPQTAQPRPDNGQYATPLSRISVSILVSCS
jgi:hypothetical protein